MKYSENYLFEEYGIMCVDEKEQIYTVPVVSMTTEEEYYEDGHGISEIELPKLEDGCYVEILINYKDNRLDIVSFTDEGYFEGFANVDSVKWYCYSDDGRYYATHYITEQIRKEGYKNILVEFVFFYNEDEVENYIDCIEDYENL